MTEQDFGTVALVVSGSVIGLIAIWFGVYYWRHEERKSFDTALVALGGGLIVGLLLGSNAAFLLLLPVYSIFVEGPWWLGIGIDLVILLPALVAGLHERKKSDATGT